MCSFSTRLQVTTHHIRSNEEAHHTVDLQAVAYEIVLRKYVLCYLMLHTHVQLNLTVDILKPSHLHIFPVLYLQVELIS